MRVLLLWKLLGTKAAKVLPALAALWIFAGSACGQLPCRYEVSAILSGPFCEGWGNAPMYARGLSNHSPNPWVCGFYTECVVGFDKAFVWTGSGAVQPLNFAGNPGGTILSSYAYDVSDSGLVVGSYSTATGPWKGFIYNVNKGTWIELASPHPQGACVPRAVNNAGMVVGSRTLADGTSNAFIFHNGAYTDLGVMNGPKSEARDISNIGAVTGWTGSGQGAQGNRAFLFKGGTNSILPILPNGTAAEGWSINVVSDVAGAATFNLPSGSSRTRAVIWRDRTIVNLGVLRGFRHSVARSISEDGIVVVGTSAVLDTGQAVYRACVWRNGEIFDLNTLIPSNSEVYLADTYAFNSRGQILCEGQNASGQIAMILIPIAPPPADITADCLVNVNDLLLVINEWGKHKSVADINQDEIVNALDLVEVIENWTLWR